MNQRPPQPLDAEERALAKALPRLQGRAAPGPDLDASILAAAQAAVQPAGPGRRVQRPRVRWIAPASLAASMLLAVGMAWHLRPLPALDTAQPASRGEMDDPQAVRMVETAPAPQASAMVQSKPAPAQPDVPVRKQANPAADNAQRALPESAERPLQVAVPASPPPAPPAPAAAPAPPAASTAAPPLPAASAASAVESQAAERAMRARTATSGVSASDDAMARDAAPTIANKATLPGSARQAKRVIGNEAEMATDAGFVDDPDEDVPPATADSPAVRDAWLQRIGQLLEQGNRQEARASLSEFRRRYPAAVLPPALRALEIEP